MIGPKTHIAISAGRSELAEAAAQFVAQQAEAAVRARGRFSIALAGGSTPKDAYALLANEPLCARIPWRECVILFGDERAVPPGAPDSNFRMATEALLSKVDVRPENVLRMRGEDDPRDAAMAYATALHGAIGEDPIDLVLLGMGDDGHTASIFPDVVDDCRGPEDVVAVYASSKEQWRITLTLSAINKARAVAFLIAGEDKADMLHLVMEQGGGAPPVPSALVHPKDGVLWYFLDRAAAAKIAQK